MFSILKRKPQLPTLDQMIGFNDFHYTGEYRLHVVVTDQAQADMLTDPEVARQLLAKVGSYDFVIELTGVTNAYIRIDKSTGGYRVSTWDDGLILTPAPTFPEALKVAFAKGAVKALAAA